MSSSTITPIDQARDPRSYHPAFQGSYSLLCPIARHLVVDTKKEYLGSAPVKITVLRVRRITVTPPEHEHNHNNSFPFDPPHFTRVTSPWRGAVREEVRKQHASVERWTVECCAIEWRL